MILTHNSMSKEVLALLSLLVLPALYSLSLIPKNDQTEDTNQESAIRKEEI